MRLFIAINLNNDTRSRLLAMRDRLREHSVRGNFSAPENLHLTLAFLGECDANQAAVIKAAMEETRVKPFRLNVDRVGRFKRDGGDIWWAGVQACKPLLELQRNLSDRLIADGFALDRRKYSPHITLGREVATDGAADTEVAAYVAAGAGVSMDTRIGADASIRANAGAGAGNPWAVESFGKIVSSIELMKSERISGKLIYTPIATVKL